MKVIERKKKRRKERDDEEEKGANVEATFRPPVARTEMPRIGAGKGGKLLREPIKIAETKRDFFSVVGTTGC